MSIPYMTRPDEYDICLAIASDDELTIFLVLPINVFGPVGTDDGGLDNLYSR